jgi:hypothetical protein
MNNAQSINEVPWHLVCMPLRWEVLMRVLENLHTDNLRGRRRARVADMRIYIKKKVTKCQKRLKK